jgi:hypothetical protein
MPSCEVTDLSVFARTENDWNLKLTTGESSLFVDGHRLHSFLLMACGSNMADSAPLNLYGEFRLLFRFFEFLKNNPKMIPLHRKKLQNCGTQGN